MQWESNKDKISVFNGYTHISIGVEEPDAIKQIHEFIKSEETLGEKIGMPNLKWNSRMVKIL